MVVERMYSVKEKLLLFKWYLMVRGQEMGLEIGGILEKKLQQKKSRLKTEIDFMFWMWIYHIAGLWDLGEIDYYH